MQNEPSSKSYIICGDSQEIQKNAQEIVNKLFEYFKINSDETICFVRDTNLYASLYKVFNNKNNIYTISTMNGKNYISPKSTSYMLYLLNENSLKNCIIDCLEHIKLYNPVNNNGNANLDYLRFFNGAIDLINAKKGYLITITDSKIWREIEINQLKRWSTEINLEDLITNH